MKQETSTLFKKLKEYSALAAPLLATASFANAQVVYTDITDKVLDIATSTGEKYKLDLNNDGIFDFMLRHRAIAAASARFNEAVPYSNTAQSNFGAIGGTLTASTVFSTVVSFGYPSAFSTGVVINSNTPWFTLNDLLFSYYGAPSYFFPPVMAGYDYGSGVYFGNWAGLTDQFLPLKVDNGPDTYYGWARCDAALDGTSLTVKDYAFQATPGVGITAGGIGNVGINTPGNSDDVLIFSFGRMLNVNFKINYSSAASVQLFNGMGQKVLSEKVTAADNAISLKQLAAGVYHVQVNYNDKVLTKQISVY